MSYAMKIELEEPYKSKWKTAYLTTEKSGRRRLWLKDVDGNQSSVTYARYLMSVKLGRFLPDDIEVDHYDGDCTNDTESNLRPMTKTMHSIKSALRGDVTYGEETRLLCPGCQRWFKRSDRYLRSKEKEGTATHCCSKKCSLLVNTSAGKITEEDKRRIKELRAQKLSCYRISEITGFARNTVMKYW